LTHSPTAVSNPSSATLREQTDALNGMSGQFNSLATGMEEMSQTLQSLF
jgi:hypothetical protein